MVKTPQKRATIRDVAKQCGLALSTVSNALANRRYVSDEAREKVLQAAKDVGYRVSYIARSMRTSRTYTIGIFIGDIANPFFPEVVRGAEDVASGQGYNLVLCNTDYREEKQKAYIQLLRDQSVDGLIVVSQAQPIAELQSLIEDQMPVVLINQSYPSFEMDYVGVDFAKGMEDICLHLWQLGHRRIGFIKGRDGSTAANDRLSSFLRIYEKLGGELDERLIQPGDWTYNAGTTAARSLLAMVRPPTAIIASNDLMALGAIEAIQEFGLKTPDHISIIGIDDIFVSSMPWANLTTLRQPKWLLGATAAKNLISRIDEPESPLTKVIIPPELIIRGTTKSIANQ